MKNSSLMVSVLSGIFQILGYVLYNLGIFTGDIQPNASSWFLWALGSVIATWSYFKVTKDWVKNILPVACSFACITTFAVALFAGVFKFPDRFDLLVLVVTVIIMIYWQFTKNDNVTNLLIQIETIFSFVPIIKEAHFHPENESLLPWVVWTLAYLLMGISVLMRYEKWWDMMYPVNYFILCGITVLVILI